MRLLVTGGAGYIGSVGTARLVAEGHRVIVLDDLSPGHADAVPAGADFVQGDLREAGTVDDLAAAHVLALGATTPGQHKVYNLGSGTRFSIREVLAACQDVTGQPIPFCVAPRRPGDPAVLVSSSQKITAELGWRPTHGLHRMAADAWTFISTRAGA